VPLEALGAEPFRKKSFCIKQVLCKVSQCKKAKRVIEVTSKISLIGSTESG